MPNSRTDEDPRRTCSVPGCIGRPWGVVSMRAGVSAAVVWLCLEHVAGVQSEVDKLMAADAIARNGA